jgi:hypothetical protein
MPELGKKLATIYRISCSALRGNLSLLSVGQIRLGYFRLNRGKQMPRWLQTEGIFGDLNEQK